MITLEPRGEHVIVLRMDDGKVNALGPEFIDHFGRALRDAAASQRAVVLAGNAKAFSAGLNLKVVPGLPAEDLARFTRAFMQAFRDLYAHPRPVVAAVDGPGLAGGGFLALCADFRFVSPSGKLGVTEVPVGIPFPDPLIQLTRDQLPPQEVAPALLNGVIRQGEAALQSGWAHRLVPSERLLDEAVAFAEELGSYNPAAYGLTKTLLRASTVQAMDGWLKTGPEAWSARVRDPSTLAAIRASFERATQKKGA